MNFLSCKPMTAFVIEDAIRLLVSRFPRERWKKPSLFHSIRVGSALYLRWQSEEICLAGLFHDALEDTPITEEELREKYGEWVAWAVKANSKDISLPKEEILQDIVNRCTLHSEGALIVKSADVLDNFAYYSRRKKEWDTSAEEEIHRCRNIATIITENLPPQYTDSIFTELQHI